MSEQIVLAGGINVRYRKSCGMCKHYIETLDQYYKISLGYCHKAFTLGDSDVSFYTALASTDKKTFTEKYNVAPNTVCDEYFEPVSTRFPLD